jgi:hypothetical protein
MWIENILSEGAHATRLRTDLKYFAESALRIRPKAGPLEPFRLNAAQLKLHQIIEDQKAKTGKVRVVVLKARQLGISTYVAARLYHRTINSPGLRTIIIGHERAASRNLFSIVKRFHDNLSDDLRPHTGTSNAEELIFDRIDSGYLVSVATTEGAGRSATAQLLHASETAFPTAADGKLTASGAGSLWHRDHPGIHRERLQRLPPTLAQGRSRRERIFTRVSALVDRPGLSPGG